MDNELYANETIDSSSMGFGQDISILDIIVLILKNWWKIAISGLILAIAFYTYSKSVSVPSYVSQGSLYIDTQREQITDDVNANALMMARDLMPTYIEILESRTFNTMVSDSIDNKYSYQQIKSMIKLTQVEGTNILNISVNSVDELDSYLICINAISLASAEILRVFEGGSVKTVDMPNEKPSIVVADLFRRGVIGFLIGAVFAVAAIVLLDIFDTRIVNTAELASRYKLPILGEIPSMTDIS